MLGLTPFGTFHTAISLIAVAAGLIALVRDQEISPKNRVGKIYVLTTIMTCLTGFGIFHHGGFGKPHVLGIMFAAGTRSKRWHLSALGGNFCASDRPAEIWTASQPFRWR